MADKLFDCAESNFDYQFSTYLMEKHFKIKWIIENFSKIPCNKHVPSPVFQLLSEGECRLQLLNDLGDVNVYLHNPKSPKPELRPCPTFEYEITKYSTALFDVNGKVRKRAVLNERDHDESFQLLKTRGLDTLKNDTLIVTLDVAADVLCNYSIQKRNFEKFPLRPKTPTANPIGELVTEN